jgi:hypothetical protein
MQIVGNPYENVSGFLKLDHNNRPNMNERKGKAARGLVPSPSAGRPLTKAQETFRTLLGKVESLRESIDTEAEQLDATLSFYAAEIVPRIARQTTLQKELVLALAPYLDKSFFPNRHERLDLKDLTKGLLDEISKAEKGLNEIELREIYNELHGVGYAHQERKTLEGVKAALAKVFAEAGLEADFSELESATSEAEFMTKAEELMARALKMKEAAAEATRCAEHGRHDTDDADLRAEEVRKKSIANIYKQLARVFHPDLEQDGERQKEKVQLMQELTEAYRQNDLHTLLRLEVEWIENEGGDIERLTEEKLNVYNEVLAGQVEGLERRLQGLVFHPRYRPVVVLAFGRTKAIDGPEKAREVDGHIAALERCVGLMTTAKTAEEIRAAIALIRP